MALTESQAACIKRFRASLRGTCIRSTNRTPRIWRVWILVNLDHEVNARETFVLEGQAELGLGRPTHDESVVLRELECAALVGAFYHFQCDRHVSARFQEILAESLPRMILFTAATLKCPTCVLPCQSRLVELSTRLWPRRHESGDLARGEHATHA